MTYKLIQGDCLTVLRQMELNTFDIGITSPPYNLGDNAWSMGVRGKTSRNGIEYKTYNDDVSQLDYELWQIDVLDELFRVAKLGASFFYNHKTRTLDGELIHPMRWLSLSKWTIRQEIIWDRVSTHNHEPRLFWPVDERIYWLTKGKPALDNVNIRLPSVWREFGPTSNAWHPAPFTSALPKMLLKAINAKPGQTIIDPFAGSCTTIKTALRRGCSAIGIDICGEYLDRADKEIRDDNRAANGLNKLLVGAVVDYASMPLFMEVET